MQLSRTLASATALVALSAHSAFAGLVPIDEQSASVLMQQFNDSQNISVRSAIGNYMLAFAPDASMRLHWNNERVVVPGVAAPAGTQEAVDAITTASRPISGNAYEDYVKVRNEFETNVVKGPAAMSYYLSSEVDYLAQQLGGSVSRDFRSQTVNVSVGSSFGWDEIKPLADDDTNQAPDRRTTLHVNAVTTHVLSPVTMVRWGLEHNIVTGLQHNPYRNVYAAGANHPERHPNSRNRSDMFVRVHQYLPNQSSVKLSYRYYFDDWGIDSHEIGTRLSQYVTRGVFARYTYRWYSQSPADFYREDYTQPDGVGGYLTGDYRMSDLSSHMFGLALNFDMYSLLASSPTFASTSLWLNYERYFNSNNYSFNTLTASLAYRF